jgi:hypothetical protein
VYLGRKWIGLELLGSAGLFSRAWPRLSAGYAAEAVGSRAEAALPDPRATLLELRRAPVEDAPAVGLGREHRIVGDGMAGAALVVDDIVAHLMAFPAPIGRPGKA